MRIAVAPLPELIDPAQREGRLAVVLDLLRASTTMTRALAAGARAVVPCLTIEEARARASAIDGSVLGGERGGVRIDGFDLANSPHEYTPEMVRGRFVVFTTTNGTRAIHAAMGLAIDGSPAFGRGAARVLVGCLNNLAGLCNIIRADGRDLLLVCAGTDRRSSSEDLIAAGAILAAIGAGMGGAVGEVDRSDGHVSECLALYGRAVETGLSVAMRESPGGRNLLALGLSADIDDCARTSVVEAVGEVRSLPTPAGVMACVVAAGS